MIQIDERIPPDRVEQFASQAAYLPKNVALFMEESLALDQNPEFYQGLAAGLAVAYQFSNQNPHIGAALSVVSKHITSLPKF